MLGHGEAPAHLGALCRPLPCGPQAGSFSDWGAACLPNQLCFPIQTM